MIGYSYHFRSLQLHGDVRFIQYVRFAVRKNVERLVDVCKAEDAFEVEYGRTNLRLTRGYEGESSVHVGRESSGEEPGGNVNQ